MNLVTWAFLFLQRALPPIFLLEILKAMVLTLDLVTDFGQAQVLHDSFISFKKTYGYPEDELVVGYVVTGLARTTTILASRSVRPYSQKMSQRLSVDCLIDSFADFELRRRQSWRVSGTHSFRTVGLGGVERMRSASTSWYTYVVTSQRTEGVRALDGDEMGEDDIHDLLPVAAGVFEA